MHEPEKKVDESWKEQVERERSQQPPPAPTSPSAPPPPSAGAPPPDGAVRPGDGSAPEPVAPSPPVGEDPLPEAEAEDPMFEGLLQSLAVQATMFLGATPDPRSGLVSEDLGQAKQTIDMLSMLERKTRGNLSTREAQLMGLVLQDLRMAFVQRMQAAQGGGPGGPAGPAPSAPAF